MVCLERIQGPIGIGHHSDPSLSANQDGHLGRLVAGSGGIFRCIEDLRRVVHEPAHKILIGTLEASLKIFYPAQWSYAYSAVQW